MNNTTLLSEVMGTRQRRDSASGGTLPLPSVLMGVEIEVESLEGTSSQIAATHDHWTQHSDASLRNGTEFVTAVPMGGALLEEALDRFFDSGLEYSMSERTSVHIHMNMTDNVSVGKFRSLFCLMYMIEPAVFRLADENRKWCSYCCPLTDMSTARVIGILNGSQSQFYQSMRGQRHQDKYYGFNTASVAKHGTIEFRYFPCTNDKDNVLDWIRIVQEARLFAFSHNEPSDLVASFSSRERIVALIEANFPQTHQLILRNLDVDDCVLRASELDRLISTTEEETTVFKAPAARHGVAFRKLMQTKYAINVTPPSRNPQRKLTHAEIVLLMQQGRHREAYDALMASSTTTTPVEFF